MMNYIFVVDMKFNFVFIYLYICFFICKLLHVSKIYISLKWVETYILFIINLIAIFGG